ncbi:MULTISPECIES: hypothetical protein [Pedobacter]|jgi:hypothetical protein|uniref:Uncharacterized protein n=1 Tax=Pedobacter roseus TaxID=336820 RepID=A0A7G9QNE0_9SPHI|nr:MULTISPECIES: hypothetical protein [Pedobacter]QNN44865.1 hypothetical protein H9L23_12650 [Pedobacter roseus]
MFNNTEFENFKKIILKRLKPALKPLNIENDFLEISTSYMGKAYEVRIMGGRDVQGNYFWEVVRVVNRSIIPSSLEFNFPKADTG